MMLTITEGITYSESTISTYVMPLEAFKNLPDFFKIPIPWATSVTVCMTLRQTPQFSRIRREIHASNTNLTHGQTSHAL